MRRTMISATFGSCLCDRRLVITDTFNLCTLLNQTIFVYLVLVRSSFIRSHLSQAISLLKCIYPGQSWAPSSLCQRICNTREWCSTTLYQKTKPKREKTGGQSKKSPSDGVGLWFMSRA